MTSALYLEHYLDGETKHFSFYVFFFFHSHSVYTKRVGCCWQFYGASSGFCHTYRVACPSQFYVFTIMCRFGAFAHRIAAKFYIDAWIGFTCPSTHEKYRRKGGRFYENAGQRQGLDSRRRAKEKAEGHPGFIQSCQRVWWRQGSIGHSNVRTGRQAHPTTGLRFGTIRRWNSR